MSKKVLIIDDDDELVESIQILLESKGFAVISANSGATGLETAKKENPDLILLDVMMTHDSDGLDIALKLKEEKTTETIPVIMQTGIRKPDYLLEGYGLNEKCPNIKGVYEKPLKPDTLLKIVNNNIRK